MIDFTFKCIVDGQEKEFEIKTVTLNDQRESQKIYNQAFSDAVKSGSIVRARLDDLLTQQGLWNDNKEKEFQTIQKQIADLDKVLAKGGVSLKQAKQSAIKMKRLREDMRELISVKTNLDTHTAEGQADNARFNYLVSVCVVYKDNKKPYFNSYEDYLNRASELVAILGAQKLASIIYGLDSDFEKKLPENKFLLKYKLINDNLEYVDSKGRLVDEDGRLIDENGRFINEEGQFIDKDGNLVDDVGEYVVDFKPFTDDDGNPIVVDNDESQTETKSAPVESAKPRKTKSTEKSA